MQRSATPSVRAAAVLVPVFRDGAGVLRLVLVRRSERGVHGGQLAFPGGSRDPTDLSLLDTALREAEEEIGLSRALVEVLAELPAIETRSTGYRIAPFLARITRPQAWRAAEAEVSEILEMAVDDLVLPENRGESIEQLDGWPEPRRIEFYRIGRHRLWGASYRILHPLLPRLRAGEWIL